MARLVTAAARTGRVQRKRPGTVRVQVKTYEIVARAVESGVPYGLTRLWKYYDGDTMTEAQMRERQQALIDAVLNDLCEVIDFDG